MAKKAKKSASKAVGTAEKKTKKTKASSGDAEPKAAKKAKKKTKKVLAEEAAMNELEQRWQDLHKKYGSDKAEPYKMSGVYPSSSAIEHKVLGWGYILSNENDRLEVLFESGPKTLISNYKK